MALKDDLDKDIRRVLPHLDEEKLDAVINFLIEEGVKKLADLRFVSVSMLKSILDTIDSCQLEADWQKQYNAPSMSSTSSSSQVRRPLQEVARQLVSPDLPVFTVESPYMPSGVKEAILNKKRPTSRDRNEFVERIVDRCREVIPNLERSTFNDIALQIVEDYPDSFKDTLSISTHGSDSLAHQIKTKYDNDKRPNRKRTSKELEAPAMKEAFGCLSWNPPLSDDQTLESQEELIRVLKAMHRLSRRDWDWRSIKTKLQDSFYLQRKEINGSLAPSNKRKRQQLQEEEESLDGPANLTIDELHNNWPFLFSSKGINYHFKILTGIDLKNKLTDYFSEEASDIVEYLYAPNNNDLRRIKRHMTKAEKQGHGNVMSSGALLMLISSFKEDRDDLLTFVDRTTTVDEAKDDQTIKYPEERTPFLIIAGDSIFDFESIYFAADGKVLSTVRNVLDAIVLLFCSYYVFSYVYASKLSGFLVFIQRAIAKLNTTNGSKCSNSQIHKRSNDRVTSFLNKFALYKQKNKEDDEKENSNRR